MKEFAGSDCVAGQSISEEVNVLLKQFTQMNLKKCIKCGYDPLVTRGDSSGSSTSKKGTDLSTLYNVPHLIAGSFFSSLLLSLLSSSVPILLLCNHRKRWWW